MKIPLPEFLKRQGIEVPKDKQYVSHLFSNGIYNIDFNHGYNQANSEWAGIEVLEKQWEVLGRIIKQPNGKELVDAAFKGEPIHICGVEYVPKRKAPSIEDIEKILREVKSSDNQEHGNWGYKEQAQAIHDMLVNKQ